MFNFVTLEKKKKNSHKYISVRLIGTTDRQTDRQIWDDGGDRDRAI